MDNKPINYLLSKIMYEKETRTKTYHPECRTYDRL